MYLSEGQTISLVWSGRTEGILDFYQGMGDEMRLTYSLREGRPYWRGYMPKHPMCCAEGKSRVKVAADLQRQLRLEKQV